ncbi:MAG: FG-GAP repeat protein [Pseudomonadota bacterium]
MLRHSTAPLALCVFILASCSGSDDSTNIPAVDTATGDTPPVKTEYTLTITSPPVDGVKTSTTTTSSKARTLATLPENVEWTLIARAPDGRGGFLDLKLVDNGNGEAEAFTYDNETGELTLQAPLDYERPIDADRDNKFELMMELPGIPGNWKIPFALDVTDQKEIFEDFPVVWLNGETEFGGLGRNITPLGDIDQDGRPDIAVAAPGRHQRDQYAELPPTGYHAAGDAYVVSGAVLSSTSWLDLDTDAAERVWRLSGTETELNLGYNMTMIGDLDEDGINDFVIASNATSIEILSGSTLQQYMETGGDSTLAELSTGTITLASDQAIDPRSFASLGDLDDDSLTDLALCAHRNASGSTVEAQVFAISGEALKGVMIAGATQPISELYSQKQAAYYAYAGNHAHCGPLSALGDVNADELVDVAIPMPGPLAGDSGILVFDGAELRSMMQTGGRITVTPRDRFFFGAREPFTHFSDYASRGPEQDYMVTPLGDVTGDDIVDFGFSWVRYQGTDDAVFIIKGREDLLIGGGEFVDIRSMVAQGKAIQLAATPDNLALNRNRVEPMHAMLAPDDGLHSTLIFVGAGESSSTLFDSYSVSVDELPVGGTPLVSLPIAGMGDFSIPRANRRLLSYVTSVGDLNLDGYGDLAIGWDISGNRDQGRVMLVSGKAIIEARARGERMQPSRMYLNPN